MRYYIRPAVCSILCLISIVVILMGPNFMYSWMGAIFIGSVANMPSVRTLFIDEEMEDVIPMKEKHSEWVSMNEDFNRFNLRDY